MSSKIDFSSTLIPNTFMGVLPFSPEEVKAFYSVVSFFNSESRCLAGVGRTMIVAQCSAALRSSATICAGTRLIHIDFQLMRMCDKFTDLLNSMVNLGHAPNSSLDPFVDKLMFFSLIKLAQHGMLRKMPLSNADGGLTTIPQLAFFQVGIAFLLGHEAHHLRSMEAATDAGKRSNDSIDRSEIRDFMEKFPAWIDFDEILARQTSREPAVAPNIEVLIDSNTNLADEMMADIRGMDAAHEIAEAGNYPIMNTFAAVTGLLTTQLLLEITEALLDVNRLHQRNLKAKAIFLRDAIALSASAASMADMMSNPENKKALRKHLLALLEARRLLVMQLIRLLQKRIEVVQSTSDQFPEYTVRRIIRECGFKSDRTNLMALCIGDDTWQETFRDIKERAARGLPFE